MSNRSFYFNPAATGPAVFLGPTEAKLMELAWKSGSVTVKKALIFMTEDTRPAYTTIMTVLGRLSEKKLLTRKKQGRSFVYYPAVDRKEFLERHIARIMTCLKDNFAALI